MLSFKEYVNEIKSRFSDEFKPVQEVNQDLVFELNGKKIEFKSKNETNSDGTPYFTWDEALALQKDNWRLPTKEEFEALCDYPFEFNKRNGIFDNRLYLPVAGFRNYAGNVYLAGIYGIYWSSTPSDSDRAWYLRFLCSGKIGMDEFGQHTGLSLRLVREL